MLLKGWLAFALTVGGQLFAACEGSPRQLLFVTNYNSGTVSVIEIQSHPSGDISTSVIDTLPIGPFPFGITAGGATDPTTCNLDNTKIYVGNRVAVKPTLSIIDFTLPCYTPEVDGTILLGTTPANANPFGIITSPDGKYLYVASSQAVEIVDTATQQVVTTVPTPIAGGNGAYLAFQPNGVDVYVAVYGSPGYVAVIDSSLSPPAVVDQIQLSSPSTGLLGWGPYGVAFTPDGSRAYVTCRNGNSNVFQIDTTTRSVIGYVHIPPGSSPEPSCIAITPDGTRAYVSNYRGPFVTVIDTSTPLPMTILDTISTGNGPQGVTISPDGKYVYVANRLDSVSPGGVGTVAVISTATNQVLEKIPVGNEPSNSVLVNIPNPPNAGTQGSSTAPGGDWQSSRLGGPNGFNSPPGGGLRR